MLSSVLSVAGQNLYDVDTRPARGFMPTADQIRSPLDAIDAVNGKLHLQIPLASLPRGRAGSGFELNLVYDSHLYDILPSIQSPIAPYTDPRNVQDLGSITSTGGWTYNFMNYRLELEQREDVDCNDPDSRPFRFRIGLPDGSMHVLHLRGYGNEVNSAYRGDGFYRFAPNGMIAAPCTWSRLTGWLTYYTSDGS